MWAGSQIEFKRPIRVGEPIVRTSTIEDVQLKQGRAGPLVFVKAVHAIQADGSEVLAERQDIVYRDMPVAGEVPAGLPAPANATWTRRIVPDDVLLFRYSALTFNAHRIHYDRRYAKEVEGYPGLVVHGPLIATLLLDLLREALPEGRVERFEFRALQPIFDTAPFHACGRLDGTHQVTLWARTSSGQVAMQASARLAERHKQ
jgi:3-methylfumaryl-CoA hydratase